MSTDTASKTTDQPSSDESVLAQGKESHGNHVMTSYIRIIIYVIRCRNVGAN